MEKFDVGKHRLVPKHSKLGEREKLQLLEKYNVSLSQLPMISRKDSAIFGLDVKPGDVVKIVRRSPTAGESVFYRVVVNA